MMTEMVYMPLLDEGTEVCRPIQAEPLGDGRYRVLGPVPEDGVWEFLPGSIVRLRQKSVEGVNVAVAVLEE